MISKLCALALVSAMAFAGAAAPAMSKEIQVAPTGDGASEAQCARYQAAINSWADANQESLEKLDEKGARRAARNVKHLINEATDDGCFVIY